MKRENPAMLCDFYEFTMANGYFRNGFYKRKLCFDLFFRNVPDGGGFAIAAGLSQAIEYIHSVLQEIYGQFRRVLLFSRMNQS